jgi:hypothetical protein
MLRFLGLRHHTQSPPFSIIAAAALNTTSCLEFSVGGWKDGRVAYVNSGKIPIIRNAARYSAWVGRPAKGT